jgi:hypothetical protein
MTRCAELQAGGRGLLATFSRSFPPASAKEASMDDPCAGVKTTPAPERAFRAPGPEREPHFRVPIMFESLEVKVLFTA